MTGEELQDNPRKVEAVLWTAVYGVIAWAVILAATWLGGYSGFSGWFVFKITTSAILAIAVVGTLRYYGERTVGGNV